MANASPRGGSEGEELGSYRLVRKLGRGGMGEVWLAEHVTIKSQVAIKLVLAAPDDEDAASRFVREAKATARIRHPGVVNVTDFGPRKAGGAYLVMELLDGETLADRLERGALTSELAIDLGVQIAEALAAAHASGVVHRDLKPANIFLVQDAATRSNVRVKLVDFGVAKATGKVTDELGVTVTGALVGTPVYMAPEQCTSRKGSVDARTDLYALGVVLYQILVGKPPFRGPTLGDLIDQHLNETPASPRIAVPAIPAKLDVLIMTLLAKEKTDRPASANEVARVLHDLRGTTPAPTALDETMASGAHPKADGSIDATVDSGAMPGVLTQATGIASPPSTAARDAPPAPALSAAQTSIPKKRRGVVLGIVVGVAIAIAVVIILLARGSSKPRIDVARSTDAELEAACHDRDGSACEAIALRELAKDKPDLSRAATNRLAACDLKVRDACAGAAMMYFNGIGVRPEYTRARKMAEAACADGSALGCESAGDIARLGGGEEANRGTAVTHWKRGCELGSPGACGSVARSYQYGLSVPRDKKLADDNYTRARQLAEAACAANQATSCRILGLLYVRGTGVEKDLVRAVAHLQRACELGDFDACGEAGEFYAVGNGVAKNSETAKRYLERGCVHGVGLACQTLALATAYGLVGEAAPEAGFAIAKRACETHGDQHCQINANLLHLGVGTTRDPVQAAMLYERACVAGNSLGCTAAATIFLENAPADPAKAIDMFTKGCALGDGNACQSLGRKARDRQDWAKAFEYFELACGLSDAAVGCDDLARAYFRGNGVAIDKKRGMEILFESCDVYVSPISCMMLGVQYREGVHTTQDAAKAMHYFDKSCTLGYANSCYFMADLLLNDASGLTRDERRAILLLERACTIDASLCKHVPAKGAVLGHEGIHKREPGAKGGALFNYDEKSP